MSTTRFWVYSIGISCIFNLTVCLIPSISIGAPIASGSSAIDVGDCGIFSASEVFGMPIFRGIVEAKVGDFNGDGVQDIATINFFTDRVAILIGKTGNSGYHDEVYFSVGEEPRSLDVGDLNNDGALDLVTSNGANNDISVLLGNGDGTFFAHNTFSIGPHFNSVCVGDLNQDSIPDLVIGGPSILFGNGDGTFQTPIDLGFSYDVEVSDLNDDGIPDIAAVDVSGVDIYLGNGAGTFSEAISHPNFMPSDRLKIAIGDVSGDGKPDIATLSSGIEFPFLSSVSVYPGNGDGSFTEPTVILGGGFGIIQELTAIAVFDTNSDSIGDVVITADDGSGTSDIFVLLGLGNNTFSEPLLSPIGINQVSGFDVSDMNGDSVADIVTANFFEGNVSINYGNDAGIFEQTQFAGQVSISKCKTADFDGDGISDFAFTYPNTNQVGIWLGPVDSSFEETVRYNVGVGPGAIETADLDGDNILDLAIANYVTDSVSILLGQGDGSFISSGSFNTGLDPNELSIGDLNGDSIPDLVTANAFEEEVAVLIGEGNGQFSTAVLYSSGVSGNGDGQDVAVADFNNDGFNDVLVSALFSEITLLFGAGDGTLIQEAIVDTGEQWFSLIEGDFNEDGRLDFAASAFSGVVGVFLGNGDGTFNCDTITISEENSITSIAKGDFNADGIVDLCTAYNESFSFPSTGSANILLGNGDGTFCSPELIDTVDNARFIASADIDNDTDFELVVVGWGEFAIHYSDAANEDSSCGSFSTISNFSVDSDEPIDIAHGDLNNDGYEDVVTVNIRNFDVSVLFNDGSGRFPVVDATYVIGGDPIACSVGDVDGDMDLDILVANFSESTIAILLNDGSGTFSPAQTFLTGLFPADLAVADFDGDSDLDIVTTSAFGSVDLLLNDGNGVFGGPDSIPAISSIAHNVAAGDLNNDNDIDLWVNGSNQMVTLENQGSGDFIISNVFTLELGLTKPAVADMDGDGYLDFAVASTVATTAYIYTNNGDGTFGQPLEIPTGEEPGVAFADLNEDSAPELILLAGSTFEETMDGLSVFRNNCGTGFELQADYNPGDGPRRLTAFDVDHDTDLDLVLVNSHSDSIAVMYNDCVTPPLLGDINQDGNVNLLDVEPFIALISSGDFQAEADCNQDGVVNLLDVGPFVDLLAGN